MGREGKCRSQPKRIWNGSWSKIKEILDFFFCLKKNVSKHAKEFKRPHCLVCVSPISGQLLTNFDRIKKETTRKFPHFVTMCVTQRVQVKRSWYQFFPYPLRLSLKKNGILENPTSFFFKGTCCISRFLIITLEMLFRHRVLYPRYDVI